MGERRRCKGWGWGAHAGAGLACCSALSCERHRTPHPLPAARAAPISLSMRPPEASWVTGMPITPNICFTPRRASARATTKHPLLGWPLKSGVGAGAAPLPAGRGRDGGSGAGWRWKTQKGAYRKALERECCAVQHGKPVRGTGRHRVYNSERGGWMPHRRGCHRPSLACGRGGSRGRAVVGRECACPSLAHPFQRLIATSQHPAPPHTNTPTCVFLVDKGVHHEAT